MNFKMVVDRNHFMALFTPLKKEGFFIDKGKCSDFKTEIHGFFFFE